MRLQEGPKKLEPRPLVRGLGDEGGLFSGVQCAEYNVQLHPHRTARRQEGAGPGHLEGVGQVCMTGPVLMRTGCEEVRLHAWPL
jgi:hypothetical protein